MTFGCEVDEIISDVVDLCECTMRNQLNTLKKSPHLYEGS